MKANHPPGTAKRPFRSRGNLSRWTWDCEREGEKEANRWMRKKWRPWESCVSGRSAQAINAMPRAAVGRDFSRIYSSMPPPWWL